MNLVLLTGTLPDNMRGLPIQGPWRSSKIPEIQPALSNDYLKKVGLYSLREGWIAVHYPNQKV